MSPTVVSILLIFYFCLMVILMYRESRLLAGNRCGQTVLRRQEGRFSRAGNSATNGDKRRAAIRRRRVSARQLRWLVFLIFIGVLFCAFRDVQNTYDTGNYIGWYLGWDVSSPSAFFDFGGEVEIGFEFVSRIIKLLCFGNVAIYLGVIALIVLSLFAAAIWKLTDKRLTVFLLLYSIYGFYYSYIVIRQGIAMAIIFYTIACVYRNRRLYGIKFLFGVLIAALFHKAAVICIVMLPFLSGKLRINRVVLFIVFLLTLALSISRNTVFIIADFVLKLGKLPIFASIYDQIFVYFATIQLESNMNLATLAIFFVIICFMNVGKKNRRLWNIMMGIECIGVLLMGVLAGWSVALRFGQFFLVAHCFLLPDSTRYIGRSANRLILVVIALFYIYNMIKLSGFLP